MTEERQDRGTIANAIERRLNRVEDQIRGVVLTIQREMERTIESLDAEQHINSLGILQGSGSDLDRLAGIREELVELQNIERVHRSESGR